jgi:hypothetical protein
LGFPHDHSLRISLRPNAFHIPRPSNIVVWNKKSGLNSFSICNSIYTCNSFSTCNSIPITDSIFVPTSPPCICLSVYFCFVLCIFVLFYVFLACSIYCCFVLCFLCCSLYFVLFYVFLCCSMYFCFVLCIFVLFDVFCVVLYIFV